MTLLKRKRPAGFNQPTSNLLCGIAMSMANDEFAHSSFRRSTASGSSSVYRRRFRPLAEVLFHCVPLPLLAGTISHYVFRGQPDVGSKAAIFPHTPKDRSASPIGKSCVKTVKSAVALAAGGLIASFLTASPAMAQDASAQPAVQTATAQPPAFQSSTERTIRALEALASKGSARAQYELAMRYEVGKGVNRDERMALSLYCRAARQDYPEAAYRAGRMHMAGRGAVSKDEDLGRSWLRRAALLGNEDAAQMVKVGTGKSTAGKAPDRCEPPSVRWGVIRMPPKEIRAMVTKMAPSYGLDPDLVLAVIAVESGYRVDVVSEKNAMGLMQLIPETAERFGVTKPFDPEQNLRGGMKYLRWLLAYFDGNVTLALAGYNAGEGAVVQYKGVPPYRETQDYVVKVHSVYPRRVHPHDSSVARSAGLPAAKQEEVAELSVSRSGGASKR